MTDKPDVPPPPSKAGPVPPPPSKVGSPRSVIPQAVELAISSGIEEGSDRIVIYGTGGIGKSTLAAWLPAPFFLDLERSTKKLNVSKDTTVDDWSGLRGKLAAFAKSPPSGVRSLVIDTASKAEELATEHVVATRLTEKGKRVDSIDGFGWGKGWRFTFDEMIALLADLDRIAELGFNVCLIAHDVSSPVPNPAGEDFIRWEPNLYAGDKKGRSDTRSMVKNWAEHVLFLGYDVFVKDEKARGSGTRTIYTVELPTHIAKSRTKQFSMPFTLDSPGAVWSELGIS